MSGCIVPLKAPDRPIAYPPAPLAEHATVTVIRAKQTLGSYPDHYILLDGQTVARLRPGQYTTFAVSEGFHQISVAWKVAGALIAVPAPPGAVVTPESTDSTDFRVSRELDCEAGRDYTLGVRVQFRSLRTELDVEIVELDANVDDCAFQTETYVPPGPLDRD